MFSRSSFVILTVLVAVAFASYVPSYSYSSSYAGKAANKSHDLIAGSRLPGDRLTLQQSIVKTSSWMQVTTVEKNFNVSKNERITQIIARDQKANGNGAYPSIVRGGPGTSNVTLKFKSQRGHGINFVVQIYSRV